MPLSFEPGGGWLYAGQVEVSWILEMRVAVVKLACGTGAKAQGWMLPRSSTIRRWQLLYVQ